MPSAPRHDVFGFGHSIDFDNHAALSEAGMRISAREAADMMDLALGLVDVWRTWGGSLSAAAASVSSACVNVELVKRNTATFESLGYRAVHVPPRAHEFQGGIHCLVYIIE